MPIRVDLWLNIDIVTPQVEVAFIVGFAEHHRA
jgi:hypothetical protein